MSSGSGSFQRAGDGRGRCRCSLTHTTSPNVGAPLPWERKGLHESARAAERSATGQGLRQLDSGTLFPLRAEAARPKPRCGQGWLLRASA